MAKKGSAKARKTMARLIAVQMLYRQSFEKITPQKLLAEYKKTGPILEDSEEWVDPDLDLLNGILSGLGAHGGVVEEMLSARVSAEQAAEPIIGAILRAGIYEIVYHPEIDAGIIISDYLTVTASFFDNRETALINGVLDQAAKLVRAA